jgi:hypothetical protein
MIPHVKRVTSSVTTVLPGTATDISIGLGERTLYKTNGGAPDGYGNYPIFRSELDSSPGTWQQIPGAAVRLAKGPGYLYVIQDSGALFRWNGSAWQGLLSGYTRDVAVAKNGRVWILWGTPDASGNYGIFYSDDAMSWTNVPGGLSRLSVSGDGALWGVQKINGNLFRWNGTWQFVKSFGPSTTEVDIGVAGSWPSDDVSVVMSGRVHESFNSGVTWDETRYCRPMNDPRTTGVNVTGGFWGNIGFYAVDTDQVIYGYGFCASTSN